MLYFAHIGITIFIAALFYLPILYTAIGVLLPDIIDKGFFILGVTPCGRYIGHSLLFPLIVGLITYSMSRNWKITIALMFGVFLHVLQDSSYFIPWFFPLVKYSQMNSCGALDVQFGIFEIITESIGLLLLIFTLGFTKQLVFIRKKIWSLLLKMR